MDLNNTYWTAQSSQQSQNYVVPLIPSANTIFYPTTTATITEQNATGGLTIQYNPQLFSNIHNPIYQSTTNLNSSSNQLQQVRIIQQNLPSTSGFDQQQQIYSTDDSSEFIKTESQYQQEDDENLLKTSKNKSTKSSVRIQKKSSNELDFLQNEHFDEVQSTNNDLLDPDDEKVSISKPGGSQQMQKIKKLGPTCRQEFCRKSKFRFCSNFDKETRQRIFDEFWNKLNWDQRHIYVATRVFRKSIIRRQSEQGDFRRSYTLVYTLRNSNGNSEQVCRDMFLNTLNISDKQVALWVKKYSIGGDGVSHTKQAMLKSMQSTKSKLDEKSGTLGTPIKNTKISNTIRINVNKNDEEFLSDLIEDDDDEKKPNLHDDNKLNCEKPDDKSSINLNIPKKPKRIRNRQKFDPNNPDKPRRTRNLVPNPERWKRNIIKRLRLEGKAYKSGPRGALNEKTELIDRAAKQLLPTCDSPQCNISRLRHCSTISEWRREQIFNDFWNKWDWNQRKIFVASMVSRKDTKRKRINVCMSRRQITLIYHLPNDHGIPVQICQKMFINTTAVGKSQVLRWIKKYSLGSKIEEDLISYKDATTHASEWLDGLPKIKSIVNGEKIFYLNPQFKNSIDFYHTYCDVYNKEQGSSNGIVIKKYIFMKMCRIKKIFLMPQNNLDDINCTICKDHIKKTNKSNNDIWEQHKIKKEKAQMEKIHDHKLAKSNRAIVLLVHLQPIKCVPILKNSVTLYKSKLSCYNFTIHDLKTDFSQCYWFSEDQCGELINNNSPESVFTSIIYDYITTNCLSSSKKLPIIIYSDGQIEQTRNTILSNALLNLSILNGVEIYQKFSEPGHSLVDDCFKVNTIFDKYIYIKKKEIYLPSQLAKSTREIKRSPKLFNGIHLDYEYFYDFSKSEHLRYNSINPGGGGDGNNSLVDSLNEKDICAIKYENNKNGKILIKLYFDDDWIELTQKVNYNNIKPILEYPKLYSGMAEIAKSKWDDLQDLKLLIPFDCQPFYDSIKYFED